MVDTAWLVALVPIGVCVGLIGSLIGVGGGFFVVPFLLVSFGFSKEEATAASLGIVLVSALSATAANARRRRVDWRTGWVLAAGTLPGAWLGREVIGRISGRAFAWSFAGLLVAVAAYLLFVRLEEGKGRVRGAPRRIVDAEGREHAYETNLLAGFCMSLVVGLVSSLFGVGGGLLLVPFLVIAFGAPLLISTATAQFVFLFTAAAGLLAAALKDQLTVRGGWVIAAMGLGVALGAQLGVAAAKRVRGGLVRGILAAVLLAVAALMVLNR